ncbi:MAG: branched-chain amino acid ABC transporter permease [Pseudomonadota bacterium]
MSGDGWRIAGWALALAAAVAAPFVIASGRWLDFIELTLFVAVLAQAWNILGGYGGQYSFGHAMFFGVGAYVQALLQFRLGVSPWAAMPLAIGAGAAVGAVVGYLSFRYGLRGSYFALITLAFAEALRVLARSLVSVTEGGRGVSLALNQDPDAVWSTLQFTFAEPFLRHAGSYYFILIVLVVAYGLVWRMERRRFGAQLIAVRENEDAAEALGVNAFRVKMKAICLSGMIAAAAGVYYVQKYLFVDPEIAFGPSKSVEALVAPIIGGLGTLAGPLLGAFFLHGAGEAAKALVGAVAEPRPGLDLILYGLILVLVLGFAPRGIAGLWAALMAPLRRRAG